MEFAARALIDSFRIQNEVKVNLIVGSSGKLTSQILHGAPFDILLAANLKYPQKLVEEGKAKGPPAIYGRGSLVLWTLNPIDLSQGPFLALSDSTVKKIAIANPETAPYGLAADQYLSKCGLDEIRSKLVRGESISQAAQFVQSKACELGIVSKSLVVAPPLHGKGKWVEIDPDCHDPIDQAAVLTHYGMRNHEYLAQDFIDFLFSRVAQVVLQDFGYTIPGSSV